jgi:integrase
MASLYSRESEKTGGVLWYCQFKVGPERFTVPLGSMSKREAKDKAALVQERVRKIKRGEETVPAGMTIRDYIVRDGRPVEVPVEVLTLGQLRDKYLETHGNGALEATSLYTAQIHLKHLAEHLGETFDVKTLALEHLQGYVNHRSKKKFGKARRISPITIKKELNTLRTVWNWGVQMAWLEGQFPLRGLAFPKADEKLPFMTYEEIERKLKAGEKGNLWECLYLQVHELLEVLEHVEQHAQYAWIYPLFCLAAHTGARRSELIRILVTDVDFVGNTVLVREKKRRRGQRTTRRVPMSKFLKKVLQDWLEVHPGGPHFLCHTGEKAMNTAQIPTPEHLPEAVRASSHKGGLATARKREPAAKTPLTRHEVHDHFGRVLEGSKWKHMRGPHVLRHSFIGACASKGVDQRFIDEWVGHQTEEQRKRYRHLAPGAQHAAIESVFG